MHIQPRVGRPFARTFPHTFARPPIRRAGKIVCAAIEVLEKRQLLSVSPAPAPVGVQASGVSSLAGKVIYTKGGHGYTWMNGQWETQRPYESFGNGMVEDFGNEDQDTYFAHYLLQAGATVVPARPVDHQSNETVVDNSDVYSASTGGFQELSGAWSNSTGAPYWSNNHGNDATHYVYSGTAGTETAVARFTPKIPVAGYYPVYAWARPFSDRVPDQTFRINYPGGSYEVHVNLQATGDGWIYLGNYFFNAGVNPSAGSVDVSNKSATTGHVVIADAIRFGNGMGDFVPTGAPGTSGHPREEEAALYWDYDSRGWLGPQTTDGSGNMVDDRVSQSTVDNGLTTDDYTADFAASDRWATYMNNEAVFKPTDRLWISFHSNASGGNGVSRGTVGLINSTGGSTANETPNQEALALLAGNTVQNELYALTNSSGSITPGYDATWSLNNPPTFKNGYSEISKNVIGTEFDATILEVAYHDNAQDALLLQDPKVRDAVGRAAYHTAVQYFNTYGQQTLVDDVKAFSGAYLPEPPNDVRATTDASGNVTIAWKAGPSSSGTTGPYGNAATGYKVYTSTTGTGFDGGVTVSSGTTLTFSGLPANTPTYFRVTAINAGGESFGSPVVAGQPQSGRRAPILIVNNYSRFDRTGDQQETASNLEVTGNKTVVHVNSLFNNAQNYVIQAASAIHSVNPNIGFESCTDAAIAAGEISLSNYAAVIWMSGRQAEVDHTFTATVQPLVTAYMNAGGKMFVSGSDIGWDLVASGNGSSFFTNTLHASYPKAGGTYTSSNSSGTHAATGVSGSIFAGLSIAFSDGTGGVYNVDSPDKVAAGSGATSDLTYSGGTAGSAAIQYTSGNTQLIYMGFPFETITTLANQNAVMSAVLNYFNSGSAIFLATPAAPDLTTASDTGSSSTDNLTKLNNSSSKKLTFTVTGVSNGATVTIYADGTPIGSGIASGTTASIITSGASTLTEGTHAIIATESGLNSAASNLSTGLTITVDTTPPTISAPTFNYLTGLSLTYTFGETLSASPGTGSVTITPDGGSAIITAASYDSSSRTVTYTFPSKLANAHYTAVFNGPSISDAAGNSPTNSSNTFFFLMGDDDRNGTVNSSDFDAIAANFGGSGKNFATGDFNYDGITNTLDFNALATNYSASVPTSGEVPDSQPLAASRINPFPRTNTLVREAASGNNPLAQSLFADQPIRTGIDLTDLIV